jgi:UPF0755 protein
MQFMSAHVWIKRVMLILLVVLSIGAIKGYSLYRRAYAANIFTPDREEIILLIPTGSEYKEVLSIIESKKIVKNKASFNWAVQKKRYTKLIKPGRYLVKNRMSNNDFIDMLRAGKQEPVKLTFNNIRTLEQFAERIAEQLEMSAKELFTLLMSDSLQMKYGFSKSTMKCMFLPDTYEVYWNISPYDFIERMYSEYNKFWKGRNDHKADEIGLSREEVITLASIVNEETQMDEEKSRIAGVYMNRLKKGMRLQADPTVIYAVGDFSIKRVLQKHYQINSPYNTYKINGLPPGPINIPEKSSIIAVLNYEKHSYLYFCAKPDFSGYHNFARTLDQHNKNAALYRKELNKRRIYR